MSGRGRGWLCLCLMVTLGVLVSTSAHGAALLEGEDVMRNQGYLRQYVSMNLQDPNETLDDDQYALNMVRTQVLLETDLDLTEWSNIHSRLRAAREVQTEYLNNLEDPAELDPTVTAGALGNGAVSSTNSSLSEFYEKDNVGGSDLHVRELYLDLDLTRSTSLRLGRQMVAWGKGSFERALDLVSGFDNTWAPFVTDEEERRKSLIMAYLTMEFPSQDGSLEAYYQPGYDDQEDIANSVPGFGGRNARNGIRGLDVTEPFTIPGTGDVLIIPSVNQDHPQASIENEKFGVRWRGIAFNNLIEYSLAFLRTHQKSGIEHNARRPFVSSTTTTGCVTTSELGETTVAAETGGACLESGEFREFIFPIIDVYGGTFNYYSQMMDVVVRGEIAYLKDRVFNQDPSANGAAGSAGLNAAIGTTVIKDPIVKDEYRLMLGFDRNAYFARDWLFADRPGRLTVEFFDFLIDDFETSELVRDGTHTLERDPATGAVTGGGLKEHSLEAVVSLNWSYASGTYGVGQTALVDMSYGGNWTYIPSLSYQPSTNWIVDLTGVFVFEDTNDGTKATSFGAQGEGDRVTTKVTYQF